MKRENLEKFIGYMSLSPNKQHYHHIKETFLSLQREHLLLKRALNKLITTILSIRVLNNVDQYNAFFAHTILTILLFISHQGSPQGGNAVITMDGIIAYTPKNQT